MIRVGFDGLDADPYPAVTERSTDLGPLGPEAQPGGGDGTRYEDMRVGQRGLPCRSDLVGGGEEADARVESRCPLGVERQ
jgi:hypothetical protein